MSPTEVLAERFPKSAELGGEPIVLRLLEPLDATTFHDFLSQLSTDDLMFLQRDVTDPREIEGWLGEIADGRAVTLIAESEADGSMFGETTLRLSSLPWTRHVGTVRVITAPAQRGRGLGRLLLEEIFATAAEYGIEKIVAEMTVEQAAARQLFEQMGFREEGRYHSYVKDRRGTPHDLLVMTRDQPALDTVAFSGAMPDRAWRCHACGHVTPASEQPVRCPDCGAAGENLTAIDGTPPAG